MKNRLTILHVITVLMMMISCEGERQNFDKAIIILKPVNFTQVNTEYDDYNSDLNYIWSNERLSLIFSTNRDSKGNDFDFILYDCDISVNLVDGKFTINAELESDSLIELINSSYNELGPFITNDIENRFFYTSDKNGSLDLYVNYYTIDYGMNAEGNTIELNGINTSYDEGYLTIHKNSNSNREKIFFTSNRDNKFDIYRALSEENKFIDQSESIEVEKINRLSSNKDDKCPHISGNIMVFASNRDGGFGGYDLWYSEYNGEEWSLPINFGENVNTKFDEYRPIIFRTNKEDFFNDLMIFSSNRPGGLGMFDLYYVGLSKTFN